MMTLMKVNDDICSYQKLREISYINLRNKLHYSLLEHEMSEANLMIQSTGFTSL